MSGSGGRSSGRLQHGVIFEGKSGGLVILDDMLRWRDLRKSYGGLVTLLGYVCGRKQRQGLTCGFSAYFPQGLAPGEAHGAESIRSGKTFQNASRQSRAAHQSVRAIIAGVPLFHQVFHVIF